MEIDLNWVGILAGAASSMVLGMVWYHEKVFGGKWMKAAGLSKKELEKSPARGMLIAILRSFLTAFALYHIIYVSNNFHSDQTWLQNSIGVAAWVGVVFVGLTTAMHDAFEKRSMTLTRINAGYGLVSVLLVGLAIGLFGSPV